MGFMREMKRKRTLNDWQRAKRREEGLQPDGKPIADDEAAKPETPPIIADESGTVH